MHGRIRLSMTWSCDCGPGPGSRSILTGSGTGRRPGGKGDGVPIEVVATLLGHSSVAVTSSVYGHLTAEDARAALEKAGWLAGKEVSW